jgi:hypothetical protein
VADDGDELDNVGEVVDEFLDVVDLLTGKARSYREKARRRGTENALLLRNRLGRPAS